MFQILDKIVSPVIPQTNQHKRKRKRTSSDGAESTSTARQIFPVETEKTEKVSPHRPVKKQNSTQQQEVPAPQPPVPEQKPNKKKEKKFVYGNYNRYYGYRNPAQERDIRLNVLHQDWFEDKDVLDIGCNDSHVNFTDRLSSTPTNQ